MDIKSIPAMDKGGLQVFSECLSGIDVFLEYGCGASTIYAANHGVKTIISVDSAPQSVTAGQEEVTSLPSEVHITYCNVGKVKAWGMPVDNSAIRAYHQYSVVPWKIAKEKNVTPELVLVDGRFRVACFLYSLISCEPGTKILFDDYFDRPYYDVVEKFCKLHERIGRMGVFIASREFDFPEIVECFGKYSIIKT
jgi:hypothetical protein